MSGFSKTGIYPTDRTRVLRRLPPENTGDEIAQRMDDSLVDMLKTVSGHDAVRRNRGERMRCEPGKSISAEAQDSNAESDKENEPDIDNAVSIHDDGDTDDSTSDEPSQTDGESILNLVAPKKGLLKVSDWVTVKYATVGSSRSRLTREYHFVGQIIDVISSTEFQVSFMRPEYSPKCRQYTWPTHDDIDVCAFNDIVSILPNPTINRRGVISF